MSLELAGSRPFDERAYNAANHGVHGLDGRGYDDGLSSLSGRCRLRGGGTVFARRHPETAFELRGKMKRSRISAAHGNFLDAGHACQERYRPLHSQMDQMLIWGLMQIFPELRVQVRIGRLIPKFFARSFIRSGLPICSSMMLMIRQISGGIGDRFFSSAIS